MRELTSEEKEKLEALIEKQNKDHEKKWRDYNKYKVKKNSKGINPSMYQISPGLRMPSVGQRFDKLEAKHQEIRRATELKRMKLSRVEKAELEAKISAQG